MWVRTARQVMTTVRSLAHRLVHVDEVTQRVESATTSLQRTVDALRVEHAALQHRLDAVERSAAARDRQGARAVSALHDTVNLVARRGAFRHDVTRVVLLVHHVEAWDSLDDLVRLMEMSDDFDPVIVTIPRHFGGQGELRDEDLVHEGLLARGVAHLRATADRVDDVLRLVKLLEPDVVIRQSQWDQDVDPLLSTALLGFARLCVVPYETMNLVVNVPDPRTPAVNTAVDADLHRAAWLVFCTNEQTRDAAARDGVRGADRYRVTGHPKLDVLRTARPSWPVVERESRRPRVVWSSHHSIGGGWTRFGLFPELAEDMLEWARQGDAEIVWMPHPALVPYMAREGSRYTASQYEDWLARWSELGNTGVVQGGGYAPVLAAADVMVTDGLSMLAEFQVLNKPVVFVERDGHRPFTDLGERIAAGTHVVHDTAGAREVVERVLREGDELAPVQERNVAELFGPPGAAGRILDVLRAEIAAERAGHRVPEAVVEPGLG